MTEWKDDLGCLFATSGTAVAPDAFDWTPPPDRTEEVADALTRPTGVERRRLDPGKRLLTLAEFARAAGIDRKVTLPALIAAGQVRTVPWVGRTSGNAPPRDRVRIPASEVERLEREGIRPPEPKRPSPKKARPAPSSAGLPASIRDLDY